MKRDNEGAKGSRLSKNRMLLSTILVVLLAWWIAPSHLGLLLVQAQAETVVDADGTLRAMDDVMFRRLSTSMPQQEAMDIAGTIEQFQNDPETVQQIASMKQQGTYQEFVKDLSEDQILSGLREAAAAMRSAELLANDPAKAFVEMEEDGMVPPHRAEEYRQNPELLVQDTLSTLYLTFLTFAGAGGFV